MTKINRGLFTSRSGLWETPQSLFDQLNAEFNFTVDVCANSRNAKCVNFFTRKIDGLRQNWGGVAYMNPPYGKIIKHWIEKAYQESLKGSVVVGLLPARTDTKWFHDFIYGKAEVRFIKGRVKFILPKRSKKNSAPFPSMIVIWRPRLKH